MSRFNPLKQQLFNLAQSNDLILPNSFLKMAMSVIELNEADDDGNTLLHYAVDNEHLAFVELLLEYEVDVNVVDYDQTTPLHIASLNGNLDLVKLLIKAGALVNKMDDQRRTPLHLAALNGDQKVLKYLLDHGADINLGSDAEYTALHDVVNEGKLDSAKFLIDHGAMINAQNNEERYTPLHCAVLNKDIKIIALLLEKGADPYAKDKDNATSAHYLVDGLIESQDVDVAIQTMQLLVKAGGLAIFDQQDNQGNKPLDLIDMKIIYHKRFKSGLHKTVLSQNHIGNYRDLSLLFFNRATQSKEEDESLEPRTKRLKTF